MSLGTRNHLRPTETLPFKIFEGQSSSRKVQVNKWHTGLEEGWHNRKRLRAFYEARAKESMGGFPSGQRGQTVNLLSTTSKVRILLRPFDNE